jgi:hypothetical protein
MPRSGNSSRSTPEGTRQRGAREAPLGRRGGARGTGAGSGSSPGRQPAHAVNVREPLLLDSRQVAQLLGIGRTKTFQLMVSGELPTLRIGRCVRVPVLGLQELDPHADPAPGRVEPPAEQKGERRGLDLPASERHVVRYRELPRWATPTPTWCPICDAKRPAEWRTCCTTKSSSGSRQPCLPQITAVS